MTVAIIVEKCATRVPTLAVPSHSRLFGDVRERAVAVVVVQNIFPEICHEQVFVTVVVVIPDAYALAPTGMQQTGLRRDVRERAVAIVLEQVRSRSLPGGKTF